MEAPEDDLMLSDEQKTQLATEAFLTAGLIAIGAGIVRVCLVKHGEAWVKSEEGSKETLRFMVAITRAMGVSHRELEAAVFEQALLMTEAPEGGQS